MIQVKLHHKGTSCLINQTKLHQRGIGAIEVILASTIFVMVALSIYTGYTRIVTAVQVERMKTLSTALANEQFELAKNLPYSDVGLTTGIPIGKLQATQTIVRNGVTFIATTTVRNIDDPFDGQLGSTTANDTSPADYKFMEITITCATCKNFQPLTYTATIAPKNFEGSSNNGALFVKAIDGSGIPIQGAKVHIVNASSSITIDDLTNAQGLLQIIDTPPGVNAYDILVTKGGYSHEQTYPMGSTTNPNPLKPHATVATQTVTQITFAIDKTGTTTVRSSSNACLTVPGIDFNLQGGKLIGTTPDNLKFNVNKVTNGSGYITIGDMEWDTYALTLIDGAYDLVGSIPLLPYALLPDGVQDIQLVVAPKNPRALMVTIKDSVTGLPITGATTTLTFGVSSSTQVTGRGTFTQTDWSGGSGQVLIGDETRYWDTDANIENGIPSGEIKLRDSSGYVPSGVLTSSTFDVGTSSNFHQLSWTPTSQPYAVGSSSVQFQIATNNDNATWNYRGPDGTASTYYDVSETNISPVHDGARYLRYKVYLQTASSTYSPIVSDVAFTATSSCFPAGQVLFTGLGNHTYTLDVNAVGYQAFTANVDVNANWLQYDALLVP